MALQDSSRPVLFFDSGVGGLSILREYRQLQPEAPLIYAADNAYLPYGEKSEREILTRVPALLGRMVERYGPRLVTIACNTASTVALDAVRAALDVEVVGTVPAIKPASESSQTGTIGLLGTAATVKQSYVDNLEREFAQGKQIIRAAAPDLVFAAEEKIFKGQTDLSLVRRALISLLNDPRAYEMDKLVLACTHFSLISDEIRQIVGPKVDLVDGALGIAKRVDHLLSGQSFRKTGLNFAVFSKHLDDPDSVEKAFSKFGIDRIVYF